MVYEVLVVIALVVAIVYALGVLLVDSGHDGFDR